MTASIWIDKATEQYERGRYSEALVSTQKAADLDAEEPQLWWLSALCHRATGDLDSALESLRLVTELSSDFASGWSLYGTILQELDADDDEAYQDHILAQTAFEHAVEIDPSHSTSLTALSLI